MLWENILLGHIKLHGKKIVQKQFKGDEFKRRIGVFFSFFFSGFTQLCDYYSYLFVMYQKQFSVNLNTIEK